MLADTTILIDFLRGKKNAIQMIEKAENILCTTEINVFELIVGAHMREHAERETEKIFAMLSRLIILPLEREGTIKAAEIAGKLIKKGEKIEETDSLIAGIALSNGITEIMTENKEHFERISGLKVITY